MKRKFLSLAFFVFALSGNAQNLVDNGSFDTPLDEQTFQTVPFTQNWFILEKSNGGTSITAATDDNSHGNVVLIENTTNNSWYKAFLGKHLSANEKGIYTVSFEAKALSPKAEVRFFFRDAKKDKLFILREGFDVNDESTKNQSAAAYSRKLKKEGKWVKVSADFDFSKTVNAFASVAGIEKKGGKVVETAVTEDTLKDMVLIIQLQNKDSKVMIDNVAVVKK